MKYISNAVFALCIFIAASPEVIAGNFERLVQYVSVKKDVPEWVLKKICIHESQSFYKGQRQAWPWVLNISGKGIWFENKYSAKAVAEIELKMGNKNIDVGLCQLNWRWHNHRVKSVEELIDPIKNMLHAADYLNELRRGREWVKVIGLYHSPSNKERALRYAQRVLKN